VLAARHALGNPAFYADLQETVEISGVRWSQMMCLNMTKRLSGIFESLERGVRGSAHGLDVISTAGALQSLVNAIDMMTTNGYWAGMNFASRRQFALLLLAVLERVVAADTNLYEGTAVARPPYAGQTAEHTNLYRRLIGNPEADTFVVGLLRRLDRDGTLLADSTDRLHRLRQVITAKHAFIGADGRRTARGSPAPPPDFFQYLERLELSRYH
jgi:hypothetical protein